MAIPNGLTDRQRQSFIETSSGVVARRSHISGGTLAAVSGTVPISVRGGTLDSLNTVVGTVNIIAVLGTLTNLQNGTLDILKAGTIDKVSSGTLNTVGMLQAGTIDKLSSGTIDTVGMVQDGTLSMLKAGTLDMLKAGTIDKVSSGTIDTVGMVQAGTLDMLKAGTIDKVSSGTINTVGMVQAGTLDMLKAGTLDMLKAGTIDKLASGTVNTVGMVQAGTLDMLKAGTVGVSQWGGTTVTGGAALSDAYTGPTVPPMGAFLMGWDGTNWERIKTDGNNNLQVNLATKISGEDQTNDVLKVEQQYSYSRIAAAGTTTVKSGAGMLHLLTVGVAGATGTITFTDGTAGGGGTIGIASVNAQVTLGYNVKFTNGLSAILVAGTAPDVTISYR